VFVVFAESGTSIFLFLYMRLRKVKWLRAGRRCGGVMVRAASVSLDRDRDY